ncbi:MAG: hypothetical protein SNG69_02425 [Rikenellaceae bacterium]
MSNESADKVMYTTSGLGYFCEKIGYHDIRLTIQYGNGQRYKLDHRREVNEFHCFAYASVVNSAHTQYIINSEDAHEIMAYLTQSNI